MLTLFWRNGSAQAKQECLIGAQVGKFGSISPVQHEDNAMNELCMQSSPEKQGLKRNGTYKVQQPLAKKCKTIEIA